MTHSFAVDVREAADVRAVHCALEQQKPNDRMTLMLGKLCLSVHSKDTFCVQEKIEPLGMKTLVSLYCSSAKFSCA